MEGIVVQNVLKVFGLSSLTFFVGIVFAPILTHFLYRHKLWRKEVRQTAPDGGGTPIFASLHKDREISVPRLGGIVIWFSVTLVAVLMWLVYYFIPTPFFEKLNFISRGQTWILFAVLIGGSLLGLIDDLMQVFGRGKYTAGGMRFSRRVFFIFIIALAAALWFFIKLEGASIFIPFVGDVFIGIAYILFFIIVMLATFSGGVIDGLDGLSGGVFASIFAAYGGIAFFQNQIDIATFCFALTGALLAFLWFNIPPARFYMSETGIMGLTTSLAVVAFLTNAVFVLPIIAFPLVVVSGSVIIQLTSKRFFKRKVFLIAPIHHHFEAIGWPSYKVTMRFWIISVVTAIIGMVIHLLG